MWNMTMFSKTTQNSLLKKCVSCWVILAFIVSSIMLPAQTQAQSVTTLPASG